MFLARLGSVELRQGLFGSSPWTPKLSPEPREAMMSGLCLCMTTENGDESRESHGTRLIRLLRHPRLAVLGLDVLKLHDNSCIFMKMPVSVCVRGENFKLKFLSHSNENKMNVPLL